MEKSRLVMPLPLSATIGVILWYLVARRLFHLNGAQAAYSGGIIGYICYDLVHFFLHHSTPMSKYLTKLKSYHLAHHYVNPNLGYGVSTKIWDYVFETKLELRLEPEIKKY